MLIVTGKRNIFAAVGGRCSGCNSIPSSPELTQVPSNRIIQHLEDESEMTFGVKTYVVICQSLCKLTPWLVRPARQNPPFLTF